MPQQLTRKRIRLQVLADQDGPVKDYLTGATPTLWRGNDVQIELGLFFGADVVNVSNISSITLEAKASQTTSDAPVIAQTVDVLDNTLTASTWTDRSKQHALIALTAAETNLDLDGAVEKSYWLTISAITTEGYAITLGYSSLLIREDNAGTAASPPTNDPTYFTAEQTSMLVSAINWSTLGGKPSTFTPSAHVHSAADITSGTLDAARLPAGIFNPVGTVIPYAGAAAPSGYVLASGRTIGNAASSATERADADCQSLFALLWADYADATLPVQTSTGTASTRGASASADWAANKRITLPDLRGRIPVGKDDMGGTAADRITTAGSGIDGAELGSTGGTETHVLAEAEMPSHYHEVPSLNTNDAASGTGRNSVAATPLEPTSSAGNGDPHQNTQPSLVLTYLIKL